MRNHTTRHLVMPALSSGLLMTAYLMLRPYGDSASSTSPAAAAAFASTWWIVAHLAGALALIQLARVGLRLDDLLSTTTTTIARWSGLVGVALVLPYYGAETFGLHAIGRAGLTDPAVLSLVDEVRGHPAAVTTFGLGLLLLAASGVTTALAWQQAVRSGRWTAPGWAAWPLGAGAALVLPQFYLAPAARMGFGIAYALAALVLVVAALRAARSTISSGNEGGQSPSVLRPRETTLRSGAKTTAGSLPS